MLGSQALALSHPGGSLLLPLHFVVTRDETDGPDPGMQCAAPQVQRAEEFTRGLQYGMNTGASREAGDRCLKHQEYWGTQGTQNHIILKN